MNDICFVFMTHKFDSNVAANIRHYAELIPNSCDYILLCQNDAIADISIDSMLPYFANVVKYSENTFRDAGYLIVDENTPILKEHLNMWGWNRYMIFNNVYLFPYLFSNLSRYSHYFFVEYDVYFNGDKDKFKQMLNDISMSEYDFIPACIEDWFDIFTFSRYNRLTTTYPKLDDFKKSFMQLSYMDNKFIQKMDKTLKEWNAFNAELFYITMSNYFGFKSSSFERLGYVDRIDYSCDGRYVPPMVGKGCFMHPIKGIR